MKQTENVTLLRIFRKFTHRLATTRKHGGQGWLLILLLENGTLTQRELIRITNRRSATLTEQLQSMQAAGYITKKVNNDDRRNVDVTLTQVGRERAVEMKAESAALADRMFAGMTEEEKEQLKTLMEKLMNTWEE